MTFAVQLLQSCTKPSIRHYVTVIAKQYTHQTGHLCNIKCCDKLFFTNLHLWDCYRIAKLRFAHTSKQRLRVYFIFKSDCWMMIIVKWIHLFQQLLTAHPCTCTNYWYQLTICGCMEAPISNAFVLMSMPIHYSEVKMDMMASQITSITIVFSTVYSDADQRKFQSSASLAFVRGNHRGPVNSPHKGPVARKMFQFDDVIMGCPMYVFVCNTMTINCFSIFWFSISW